MFANDEVIQTILGEGRRKYEVKLMLNTKPHSKSANVLKRALMLSTLIEKVEANDCVTAIWTHPTHGTTHTEARTENHPS